MSGGIFYEPGFSAAIKLLLRRTLVLQQIFRQCYLIFARDTVPEVGDHKCSEPAEFVFTHCEDRFAAKKLSIQRAKLRLAKTVRD